MKKKIIIAVVVLFILGAIGGAFSDENDQSNNTSSNTQSASQADSNSATDSQSENANSTDENANSEETTKAKPKVSVDSILDSVKIDSYEVTKDGVTLNLSNDDDENDWVTCNIKSFSFNDETVYMEYDSDKDKYVAKGVTVKENGKTSYWGMFQLQGGASTKIKFSVKNFKKIEDYNGFKVTMDLKYAGSFTGEMKDDYIQVHVS